LSELRRYGIKKPEKFEADRDCRHFFQFGIAPPIKKIQYIPSETWFSDIGSEFEST